MSVKDQRRLAIAIGLVAVVAAALYFLVFRKPKPTEQAVAARPAAGVSKAPAPGKGLGKFGARGAMRLRGLAGGAAAGKARAGLGKGPGARAGGGAFAALRARAPGAGMLAALAVKPAEPYRADPFAPLFPRPKVVVLPPPPLPAVVQVGLPPVMAQLLPVATRVAREREQVQRRTAGVLWDHQVYAIIETEKTVAVVQPGDTVDGDTVRAISPQGLVLAVKGGEEVEVPLRSRPAGTARPPSPARPQTRPGLPGSPGA